jgi:hypothetical protein
MHALLESDPPPIWAKIGVLPMIPRVSRRFYLEGHKEGLAGSDSDCDVRVGCYGASKMHAVSARCKE